MECRFAIGTRKQCANGQVIKGRRIPMQHSAILDLLRAVSPAPFVAHSPLESDEGFSFGRPARPTPALAMKNATRNKRKTRVSRGKLRRRSGLESRESSPLDV